MRITLLPIAERELRVAARNPKTWRGRFTSALVVLLITAWSWVGMLWLGSRSGASSGVFSSLAHLCFILCLFAGVGVSDTLSSEKREGTLGLLFLTDLRGYDVVLGKLVSSSLQSFYTLLGAFPILALPMLAGGVERGQFLRAGLALLNTLLFSVSVGLFVSALCRDLKRATSSVSIILGVSWMGVGGLCRLLELKYGQAGWISWLGLLTPSATMNLALSETPSAMSLGIFWQSLGLNAALSVGLLAGASLILPHAWQDKAPGRRAASLQNRLRNWRLGNSAQRQRLRDQLLDVNAFYWLAARRQAGAARNLAGVAVICLGTVLVWWCFRAEIDPAVLWVISVFLLHLVTKLRVAGMAARQLGEERESGSIELLLSTPMTVREIVRGQWLALRRACGPSLLLVLAADIFALWLCVSKQGKAGGGAETAAIFLSGMFMLLLDFAALGWLGMWFGLTLPARKASGAAAGRILFLPWVLLYGTMIPLSVFGWMPFRFSFWFMLSLYWLYGVGLGLFYSLWARRKLRQNFRSLALARFDPGAKKSRFRWFSKSPDPLLVPPLLPQ